MDTDPPSGGTERADPDEHGIGRGEGVGGVRDAEDPQSDQHEDLATAEPIGESAGYGPLKPSGATALRALDNGRGRARTTKI